MADTFEQIWREVRLYSPSAPAKLCQNWVRDSFRDILRSGHLWSWALSEDQWTFPAQYNSGTVTLTNDSKTVTGAGVVWTSAHKGLQFQTGDHIYTITAVSTSSQLSLDRKWGKATNSSASYTIKRAYVKAPSNIKGLYSVIDPDEGWRLHTHISQVDLDRVDPGREATGTPSVVCDLRFNATTSRPMYEVWPHVTSQKVIRFLYWKKQADVSSTASVPYPLDGDIIKMGALQRLCLWAGTPEAPNPMFSRLLAKEYEQKFILGLRDLQRDDSEIYVTHLWYDMYDNVPYVPLDAEFVQKHAL